MRFPVFLFCLGAWAIPAEADPVHTHFHSNDYFGDGADRWRSASFTSVLSFNEAAAVGLDLHLRAELITPRSAQPQRGVADRAYAGVLGFGLTRRGVYEDIQWSLGAEVTVLGDQNGMRDLQRSFHENVAKDGFNVSKDTRRRIENSEHLTLQAEVSKPIVTGEDLLLRNYLAAQVGYESYLRAGVDMVWGPMAEAGQYLRDPLSGHIVPNIAQSRASVFDLSFVLGADVAWVESSALFPQWSEAEMEALRWRARFGAMVQVSVFNTFFGITHLSKEFAQQSEGQSVGTLVFDLDF